MEILKQLGPDQVVLHSMDDYYLQRSNQVMDEDGYLNFDLPSSFEINTFYDNLVKLKSGKNVEIKEYVFNAESSSSLKTLLVAPIILVEGLFINHFAQINELIDYQVFVTLDRNSSYQRRLIRDQKCRNYKEAEISHRFFKHAEPAYKKYIEPFENQANLILDNNIQLKENIAFQNLIDLLEDFLNKKGDPQ